MALAAWLAQKASTAVYGLGHAFASHPATAVGSRSHNSDMPGELHRWESV